MSLRTNPSRNNSKGADERKEANKEKLCKVSNCDATRHNFTGYCSKHGNNLSRYGDPHHLPVPIFGDYQKYYLATLKYIESHMEELSEPLAKAELIIRCPDIIRYHDMTQVEQWYTKNDYRDNGYPVTVPMMEILLRWRKKTRLPKHFLASILAPYVYAHQEPKRLFSGRPVHMVITRSLMTQCVYEQEWEELSSLNFKKVTKKHYASPRNLANTGLRLTSMFTKVIAQVYKDVPKVIDEVAEERREKLEYYKMLEKRYTDGDPNIYKEDLERLWLKLGL